MYVLNFFQLSKKMTVKELRDVIFENYYGRFGFPNENSYYSIKTQKKNELSLLETKLIERIPNAANTKQYYQLYLNRKSTKLVK